MTRSNIRNARGTIGILRGALLSPSPEEIGQCLSALVEATQCLGSADQELQEQRGERVELLSELVALKRELRVVNKLIQHGVAFYQGWAHLLGAATGGYMPSGEAAPLTASGAISIRG
jgi:hypothetical protein